MRKETFEEFVKYIELTKINDDLRYAYSGKDYLGMAWNHQQTKLDQRDARILELEILNNGANAVINDREIWIKELETKLNNYNLLIEKSDRIGTLKQQLKEANEILNKIDQSLCERIIDDCGFNPKDEDWNELHDIVVGNSDNSQKDLDLIREYQAKYKGK